MCHACYGPKEPPLDPPWEPEYDEDEIEFTEEDIRNIKADERDDNRRGK